MRDSIIGVGVVGCGEIAQVMHLPYLRELPAFSVAAICDVSTHLLAEVGREYGVASRYPDYRDLLADRRVDAVVVSTYDHASIVGDALAAGKHVIVEKPLAFTPEEAQPLVEQAERSGQVAMVGYMKLYDPGYEIGLERIGAIGTPKSIHVHDFAGRFDRYQQLYTQHRAGVDPSKLLAASRAAIEQRIETKLGPGHRQYRDLYTMLLMLGSHDLAVLRGAFGSPERVAFAKAVGRSHFLGVLEYKGGVPCLFEIGVAPYEWWDEWLLVHGEQDEVRIEFQNPYWRHASAVVRIREAYGSGPSERVIPGAPDTAFRRELKHFADCILEKKPTRTPLAGGLQDLDLAVALIKSLPAADVG
jgi:predicted dehydrogenase